MSRSYVIDAYNALYKLCEVVPEDPDTSRKILLQQAREALKPRRGGPRGAAKGGDLAHLVFDSRLGSVRGGSHGKDGLISWSYALGSADDAIVEIVRENDGKHEGKDIVVVTDDRELRGRVKQLGAASCPVYAWFGEREEPSSARDDPREGAPPPMTGKPFTPQDFGMTDAPIDLDG